MRDVYLQRRPADIDIATSASPSRVKSAFKGDPMVDLPRSTVKLTHQGEVRGVERAWFGVSMSAMAWLGQLTPCDLNTCTVFHLHLHPLTLLTLTSS